MIKPPPGATVDWGDPITKGLRNWYLMNEGAGTLVANIVDFKANGLMTNMAQGGTASGWCGSGFGGGIKYDGSNDYVKIINDVELDWIKSTSFTISVWAKPFSGGSDLIAFIDRSLVGGGGITYGISWYYTANLLVFVRNTGTSAGTLNRGGWVDPLVPSYNKFDHFVWVYKKEDASIQCWFNGIRKTIVSPGFNSIDSLDISYQGGANDLGYNIGSQIRGSGDTYGYGIIDSVRMWDRALSPVEICRLYSEYDAGLAKGRLFAFPTYGLGAWNGKLAVAGNTGVLTADIATSNLEAYMVLSFRGLQASVTAPPSLTPTKSVSPSITVSGTPTISVSSSITPTITVSSSITISISITPSITITPSISLSISVSPKAAPTVANTTEDVNTTASTTLDVAFVQTTGNLVVIFISTAVSTALSSISDGFTDLTNLTGTFHIIYKTLDGSEGGNVTMTVTSTKFASIAYNISGHDTGQAPYLSTVATGTSTAPNPTTVTPGAGSNNYLWIAAASTAGEEADDDTWASLSAGLSGQGFGSLVQKTTGTGGVASTNASLALARMSSIGSSMDPDAFTTAQSLAWRAYAMAIKPA